MSIAVAAVMGGNGRLNEDSLCIGKGRLAQSNAKQVEMCPPILESLDLEIARPNETRAIFVLEQPDKVVF